MKNLIAAMILFALVSCSKENEFVSIFLECTEHTENFKAYNGEDIGCKSYYTLTRSNGQYFIQFDNRCADLIRPIVINENCEDICDDDPFPKDSSCANYFADREELEIILIEE